MSGCKTAGARIGSRRTPFRDRPRKTGHFLQALQEQVAVAAEPCPSGIVAEAHSG